MGKENIILYSLGCPRCTVLHVKLQNKNIEHTVCADKSEMEKIGIEELPVLSVNGKLLNFTDAVKWVNSKE